MWGRKNSWSLYDKETCHSEYNWRNGKTRANCDGTQNWYCSEPSSWDKVLSSLFILSSSGSGPDQVHLEIVNIYVDFIIISYPIRYLFMFHLYIYKFFRREYINLLNANTFSLDAMADINVALREAVMTNNWSKHEHVQWIVDLISSIFDSITPFTWWIIGCWSADFHEIHLHLYHQYVFVLGWYHISRNYCPQII